MIGSVNLIARLMVFNADQNFWDGEVCFFKLIAQYELEVGRELDIIVSKLEY